MVDPCPRRPARGGAESAIQPGRQKGVGKIGRERGIFKCMKSFGATLGGGRDDRRGEKKRKKRGSVLKTP